jgi:integrase
MIDENKSLGNNLPNNQTSGNAFLEVHKKKKYTSGQRALTQDQLNRLLLCVTDLVHLGMLQLAVTGGLRREDLCKVKTSDVNFNDQSVTFYESKKKRIKKVYIPVTVMNTLRMIVNVNKKEPYLFPGNSEKIRGHGHVSGRNLWNIFKFYCQKTELEPRPFHSLRATCIKLAQKKGWSVEQTAQHVGDTISVIQEHYTTPSEEEMKEVINRKPIL